MAGTTKSELPCGREHDFDVLSNSRKGLHFGVVLVPPFGTFGVSYRRKHGFQRCFIFARFLDRLLHHFKHPKSPPKACKMGIHFWNQSAGLRSNPDLLPTGLPLPPEPPSPLIPALCNVHSASLRFPSSAGVVSGSAAVPSPPGTPLSSIPSPYNVHSASLRFPSTSRHT